MSSIKGFIHCYAANNWRRVLREQLAYIQKSGLSKQTAGITILILSNKPVTFRPPSSFLCPIKVRVITPQKNKYDASTLDLAEGHTLLEMHLASLQLKTNEEAFYWYIHGKGVSRYKDSSYPNAANWRRLCESIVIGKHRECVEILSTKDIDACGPLLNTINHWPHFSGNFWWARASHVKKLRHPFIYAAEFAESEKLPKRWAAEAWILSGGGRAEDMFYVAEALESPWLYDHDLSDLLVQHGIAPESKLALGLAEKWRIGLVFRDRLLVALAQSRHGIAKALKHAIKGAEQKQNKA